ncbi:3-dehydroquinate dehydratase (3-dehydroquinase) [Coelomomyces lativittatus]|nr:3-dehydroquinate dehydratase (3-dehydroquinase) [Coelomomyces lativittatus]
MQHAIQVKLNLVNEDLKESNVRAYLNYGHTIGHAVEWGESTDTLLHGECVAIGMVLEAKLAHWLGLLSLHAYHLIEQACLMQGLPTQLPPTIPSTVLLERMTLDKKCTHELRMVLLKDIGEPILMPISMSSLHWLLSDACYLSPISSLSNLPRKNELTLDVPGSKSITNRALLLAALGKGTVTFTRVLYSMDTRVMLQALQTVGLCDVTFLSEGLQIHGHGGTFHLTEPKQVYLENAGTAVRFLTVCFTLAPYFIDVHGDPRMQVRPLAPLLDALKSNGGDIECLQHPGYVPLRIHPGKFKGGKVKIDAEISSQYVSALLMCAPYAESPMELELMGDKVVSEPYIQMTIAMMRTFGIHVTQHSKFRYSIPLGTYTNPETYDIEADASSATYMLAIAALSTEETTVTVPGLGSMSLQGDAQFSPRVLRSMGCHVEQTETYTKVTGPTTKQLQALGDIDMATMTDAFLTLAVLASVASGTTVIKGIENQRVKECNRIHAVVMELQQLGVNVKERADGLSITGPTTHWKFHEVACHNDHRMAMAFSLLALKTPLVIRDKKCVEKTWPLYFETLVHTQHFRYAGYRSLLPSRTSIVLIGMRGMGKSTLGAYAAQQLGMYFIDLDTVFESIHGAIHSFIEKHGWNTFRQKETLILKGILPQYQYNTIIATGGGIIESMEAYQILKACHLFVVHVRRGWLPKSIVGVKKPLFEASELEVFQKRLPRYEEANLEFVIPELKLGVKDIYDWEKVQISFVGFLSRLDKIAQVGSIHKLSDTSILTTGFVSLSGSSIEQMLPEIDILTHGVDAIELRLDLLHLPKLQDKKDLLMHPTLHTFAHAYFTLKASTTLPIVVTLRSSNQGGQFPDTYSKEFVHLIFLKCIQWRVEILDVEVSLENNWIHLLELKEKAKKNNVVLLPSYHDPKGSQPWTSQIWDDIVYKAKQVNRHLIKLVSYAHNLSSNFELMAFREKHKEIPQLILINMGWSGRITRIFSSWTPVTHASLQPTASGQLTLREVYQLQGKTLMQPRKFYLFGDPIHSSPSPYMHSKAFAYFGLDVVYTYMAKEGPETLMLQTLQSPQFGGASVTIPHKRTICSYVNELDPDVHVIGAANTVYLRNGQWVGGNTDWKAIHAKLKTLGPLRSACVLGAGGTARAAVYALTQLRPPPCVLYVCNRTLSNANTLINDFQDHKGAIDMLAISLDIKEIQALNPHVLINTLPQLAVPPIPGGLPSTHVVELGYLSDGTSLMKERPVKSMTQGLEILIEQGVLQFELWTGLVPPRQLMEDAVKEFFSHQLAKQVISTASLK